MFPFAPFADDEAEEGEVDMDDWELDMEEMGESDLEAGSSDSESQAAVPKKKLTKKDSSDDGAGASGSDDADSIDDNASLNSGEKIAAYKKKLEALENMTEEQY